MASFINLVCLDCQHAFEVETRVAVTAEENAARNAVRNTRDKRSAATCGTARCPTRTVAPRNARATAEAGGDPRRGRAAYARIPRLTAERPPMNIKRLIWSSASPALSELCALAVVAMPRVEASAGAGAPAAGPVQADGTLDGAACVTPAKTEAIS
jgi:hypothetical protein